MNKAENLFQFLNGSRNKLLLIRNRCGIQIRGKVKSRKTLAHCT